MLGRDGVLQVVGDGLAHRLRVEPRYSALAVSADGSRVAVGGERRVQVFDTASGREELGVTTRDRVAAALGFADDSVVWVDANEIHIRSLTSEHEALVQVPGDGYWRAVTTDGTQVLGTYGVVGAEHDRLALIDAADGTVARDVELPTLSGSNLEVLGSDRLAYSDREHSIIVIDRNGAKQRTLRAEGGAVLDLQALPDGRGLASVDTSDVVEIWDAQSGARHELEITREHGSVAPGGPGRRHYDASLALDEKGALWALDRSGELSRYELRVPWPGPELAPWIRARVHREPRRE